MPSATTRSPAESIISRIARARPYSYGDDAELVQQVDRLVAVRHQAGLGDLEQQAPRIHAVPAHDVDDALDQPRMPELDRGQIDVHAELAVAGQLLPFGQLAYGGIEHPAAEIGDQAALLGDADELIGRHHAALRMLPAHQC